MLSELEFEKFWQEFDPFQDHEIGNDFCPACYVPNHMCHVCGNIMHNSLYTTDDETLIENLCESCGYYYTEESK